MTIKSEPCKFPFNRFGGERKSRRIWNLKGESGGTGFKAKREIIRAGPWRKAERGTGEGWRSRRGTKRRTRTSLGMRGTNCRKGEQGWRTVGMFNDRELQVMASNAAYLTPPPYPIARNNLCVPVNIFLSSLAEATRRETGRNRANDKCEPLFVSTINVCACIRKLHLNK